MLYLWILQLLFVPAYQMSDPNCLRGKIGSIDAEFTFPNRYKHQIGVSAEDVAKHIALFSTRFRRAHLFSHLIDERMKLLKHGISLFSNTSTRDFDIFLSAANLGETEYLRRAVLLHKQEYNSILKVNSGNEGPVVGLYLTGLMNTWAGELEAVMIAFGPIYNSSFAVGHWFKNCTNVFRANRALNYLQRLHFITCDLVVSNKASAEESADDIIRTCDNIRDRALAMGVTAEIRCRVGYPSYGVSKNGLHGSLVNFQKFWCRIFGEITPNPGHAQIIIMTAFDDTPFDYIAIGNDLNAGQRFEGWWRRRVTTAYGATAFVEKVEELRESGEPRNCTEECSFCDYDEKCCDGMACTHDLSFQPFEKGEHVHVCRSIITECAIRYPDAFTTPSPLKLTPSSSTQASQPHIRTTQTNPSMEHSSELPQGSTPKKSGRPVVLLFCLALIYTVSIAFFLEIWLCVSD